jgi:hypothetical protein
MARANPPNIKSQHREAKRACRAHHCSKASGARRGLFDDDDCDLFDDDSGSLSSSSDIEERVPPVATTTVTAASVVRSASWFVALRASIETNAALIATIPNTPTGHLRHMHRTMLDDLFKERKTLVNLLLNSSGGD